MDKSPIWSMFTWLLKKWVKLIWASWYAADVDSSWNLKVALNWWDIQLWAVELKDWITDVRVTIATDDSAMVATPNIVPVWWEYRATDTVYADWDATVLQTDENWKLKVSGISSWAGGSWIVIWSQIWNYSFDASAQTVTITWTKTFKIEEVLQIVNQTDWIVIYDPQDPKKGWTIANNIITLEYNTTAMADTDYLIIRVEYNNSEDYDNSLNKTQEQSPNRASYVDTETLVSWTNQEAAKYFVKFIMNPYRKFDMQMIATTSWTDTNFKLWRSLVTNATETATDWTPSWVVWEDVSSEILGATSIDLTTWTNATISKDTTDMMEYQLEYTIDHATNATTVYLKRYNF